MSYYLKYFPILFHLQYARTNQTMSYSTIVHTRPNLITKIHPLKCTIKTLPDFDEKVCGDKILNDY